MRDALTIGKVARRSGVPARTIRFYEAQGIIPAPMRTEAGYRLYTANDVRRLRLARRVRLLGVSLPEVKALVTRAFSSECGTYAEQLLAVVHQQRGVLDRRIAELRALRAELDALEEQARAAKAGAVAGLMVAACGRCPLIDERTGAAVECRCGAPPDPDTIPATKGKNKRRTTMPTPDISREDRLKLLEGVGCDISARPAGAPTPRGLAPFQRDLRREAGQLIITFDSAAADAVAALAEAERRCCAHIDWEVEQGDVTTLRVVATPTQVDVIEQAFAEASSGGNE